MYLGVDENLAYPLTTCDPSLQSATEHWLTLQCDLRMITAEQFATKDGSSSNQQHLGGRNLVN